VTENINYLLVEIKLRVYKHSQIPHAVRVVIKVTHSL